MDLIHYSFMPLILFCVPYTLDLLPYYLSIVNGGGGVSIFELLLLNQTCAWFLRIDPVWIIGMRVRVRVCVSAPKAIYSQWRDVV